MGSVAVKKHLLDMQERIVERLKRVDGKPFQRDKWSRGSGQGMGICCMLEDGAVLERAGVAFSHVAGDNLPAAASAKHPELAGSRWEALSLSLVIHPRNPYAPSSHANVRLFIAHRPDRQKIFWFGGSMDLTPCYGFEEDAVHFHQTCKNALTKFDPELYPRYKKACDDYFYLPHRDEHRGIGGILFDDLNTPDFDTCFALTKSVSEHFLPAYMPVLERRKDTPYGEREREFQLYRRGRYVEFNLLNDRGTIFGLKSGGRTESILLSMPPQVSWRYDWHPAPGSPEAELYEKFLQPRDWI